MDHYGSRMDMKIKGNPLRSENSTRQALALASVEVTNMAPVVDDWIREVQNRGPSQTVVHQLL